MTGPHHGPKWASIVCALFACDTQTPAPEAGSRCEAPPRVCAADLVCVDGLCRVRPPAPSPLAPPESPLATFDVVTTDVTDAANDTQPDTQPVERIVLGDLDENAIADTRLSLSIGQAAVTQLVVPFDARPELVRLVVFRHGPGCGLFRPLLWMPRDPDKATFAVFPDVIGTALPLDTRDDAPAVVELPLPALDALVGPATYRVGVRYEGPCTMSTSPPFIALDTSGDTTQTFVWADTWIPGADLSLPGRWAMALQVTRP